MIQALMVKHRYHARLTKCFSLIFLWRIRLDSALPLLQARLTWIQWQILFVKTPKLAGQIRLACTAAVFQAPSNKSRHDAGPLMTNLDCIIIFMENYPVEKKKRRQKKTTLSREDVIRVSSISSTHVISVAQGQGFTSLEHTCTSALLSAANET